MSLIGVNFKKIGDVPLNLLEPITLEASRFNWSDIRYNQPILTSPALAKGKTLEYPFVKKHPSTANRAYTEEERLLINSSFGLFKWLVDFLGSDIVCIRCELATIMPKTSISWHIDSNHDFFKHCTRVHVPITSNDQCLQLWKDEEVKFEIGSIYEYNNQVTHSAVNNGDTPRTTLILDYVSFDKWTSLVKLGVFKKEEMSLGFFDRLI